MTKIVISNGDKANNDNNAMLAVCVKIRMPPLTTAETNSFTGATEMIDRVLA